MTPDSLGERRASAEASIAAIEKRLRRERLARREVEEIAERATRELYDKQQELVLLEAVVSASNESSTVERALQGAVDAICAHTSWPLGHAYVRDSSSGDLLPTAIWHIDQAGKFTAFRRVTEQMAFSTGVGLPGRVLATGRAAWITDVTIDPNFTRKNLGVRGAFALPIHENGETQAVLEFFTPAAVRPDSAQLDVMAQIGRQLGRVMERIRAQEQIAHQATHDALTGLANRILFRDRLELALARAERHSSFVALLFLDLDRFKDVNDTLGHDVGDQLLKSVSDRLQAALRASDTMARFGEQEFTLARFGGDEFVVLCEDLASEGDAVPIAQRVQRALLSPFVLEHMEHVMTASIGIVVSSGTTRDAESLLRDADIAMYRAKQRGPGNWEIFDEVLRNLALERVATERELRKALEAGQLRLHYQPIVTIDGGRIESVEALVRWQHPKRGLLPPGEFIPIAEESPLILQIGAWTLREACEQAYRWRACFGDRAPLPVSVNVSARQLTQGELPGFVRQVLAETGLSTGDLAIEVTETALMEDSSVPAASLRELRSLGVKILLDDFGTGYSSLSHLQRFPIDVLKIDRSFVKHLGAGADHCAIVRAIAAMAGALRLEVVAEGVETAGSGSAGARLRAGAGVLLRAPRATGGHRVAAAHRSTDARRVRGAAPVAVRPPRMVDGSWNLSRHVQGLRVKSHHPCLTSVPVAMSHSPPPF
ncbi:MAG: putative bifunctional diguanylate cyclase/phosphodiesterase [Actinomycetota bacterium]